MNEREIRKNLAALRRIRPSGTTAGLRAQMKKLAKQFGDMSDSMKPQPKPKREETAGQDRQEHGGHDRSDN